MFATSVLMLAALAVQIPTPELSMFLSDRLDFSGSELANVVRGEVVTKTLEAGSDKEVTLVGVVRIEASQQDFLARFRDIESFLQSEEMTQIGQFGTPPGLADVAELTLRDEDFDAMRDCRSGDCDVKLSAARIAELRAMDWAAPDHPQRLAERARTWLIDYVRAYVEGGNAALLIYDDRDQPQSLNEGFRELLAESPYVFEYVPEFHHYMEEYPRGDLPGSEDVLYWAVEDFGLKPLTSVTHATIYRRPVESGPGALIALKQIYASHYFHAALKLMALVDPLPGAADDSFYLVYLDRSLFDTKIGGLRRRIVQGRMRDNLESRLESIRGRFAS